MDKDSYREGSRRAWLLMLQECLIHLGVDDPDAQRVNWVMERQEALAKLREICQVHGDMDWEDDAYLPDVLEHHLQHYLEA